MAAAAKYRDALTIQSLVTPVDPATGEQAVESESNWQDYFPCFGEVIVKGTREFIRAGIVDADVSHIIRVPGQPRRTASTAKCESSSSTPTKSYT